MRTKYIFRVLPVFTILCACQSEAPQEITESTRCLMVKASLPNTDNTRTQISYGNPDKTQEIFSWIKDDEIFLYNMTRFKEFPDEACFAIQPDFGRNANFIFVPGSAGHAEKFKVCKGDTLLAFFGDTNRVKYSANNVICPDERNIVRLTVGAQSNYPQYIFDDPDDSTMSYMQDNLKMYDIVTAIKDDEIPDLHFKHLSAILRITLRNETGHDIYPTKLEFEYPGTESFFCSSLYCSVDQDSSNSSGLKVYDNGEFFGGELKYIDDIPVYNGGSPVYADSIGTTVNGKNGTIDAGGSIKNGAKYDLYISTVPKINNKIKGEKGLIIRLIENHKTNVTDTYAMNLDVFDVPIEAGKRYWFNLTAVEEIKGTEEEKTRTRKLMLTSEWLKDHPEAKSYYE